MHITATIGLGSILNILTIIGALGTFGRWLRKLARIEELPAKLDKVNENLSRIESATTQRHEENLRRWQDHIMDDHRPSHWRR